MSTFSRARGTTSHGDASEKFGALILIFGLAVELGALVRTNQIFSLTIASLNKEAGDAHRDANTAKLEAEQLRRDNLLLQREVLNLRERMADRRLTPDQKVSIKAILRRFHGITVNLFCDSSDDKAKELMRDIANSLPVSDWTAMQATGHDADRTVVGVLVEINLATVFFPAHAAPTTPVSDRVTGKAANSAATDLVAALNKFNISAQGPEGTSLMGIRWAGKTEFNGSESALLNSHAQIKITIGRKP